MAALNCWNFVTLVVYLSTSYCSAAKYLTVSKFRMESCTYESVRRYECLNERKRVIVSMVVMLCAMLVIL